MCGLTPDEDEISQRNEVSHYCQQKQNGNAEPAQERDLPSQQTASRSRERSDATITQC